MDAYQAIRSLSFPSLASALGIDLRHFKQRANGEHYGPCPIHGSKQNQTCFSYHPDGRFNCFSCSAKGRGAIDLTMAVRSINFTSACEFLAGVTIEPAKEKSPAVGDSVSSGMVSGDSADLKPLAKDTWRKFAVPCPWLEQRIPEAGVREKYGVFCYSNPARKSAWSGRVMIPIKDAEGILYGYLGRSTLSQTEPKYLFPRNLPKSRFLFGAHELAQRLQGAQSATSDSGDRRLKVVYLVESPFCVMKFAMWGIPAVSPFGWAVSTQQLQILQTLAKGLVCLPDRNKTAEFGHQALPLLASQLWCRLPELPTGIDDPEHLSREQLLSL